MGTGLGTQGGTWHGAEVAWGGTPGDMAWGWGYTGGHSTGLGTRGGHTWGDVAWGWGDMEGMWGAWHRAGEKQGGHSTGLGRNRGDTGEYSMGLETISGHDRARNTWHRAGDMR